MPFPADPRPIGTVRTRIPSSLRTRASACPCHSAAWFMLGSGHDGGQSPEAMEFRDEVGTESGKKTLPEWWDWELELSPHLLKRMEDRQFNEVDLRTMLARATSCHPDIVEGRWGIAFPPDTCGIPGKSSSNPISPPSRWSL